MTRICTALLGGLLLAGCGAAERVGLRSVDVPQPTQSAPVTARTAVVFGDASESAPKEPPQIVPAVAVSLEPTAAPPAPNALEVVEPESPAPEYISVGTLPEAVPAPDGVAPAAYGTAF